MFISCCVTTASENNKKKLAKLCPFGGKKMLPMLSYHIKTVRKDRQEVKQAFSLPS